MKKAGKAAAHFSKTTKVARRNQLMIQIQWKDRDTVCQALVASNANDVLLGIIPLGALNLIIDPVNQELVGAHGDKALIMIK
jgi:hypothetical protein